MSLQICSICHDDMFTSEGDVVSTKCGHLFHGKCIKRCFLSSNSCLCPMCRMTINLNNLRSLHVYEEEENELSRLQRWLKLGEKFSSDYKKLKDENDKLKRELEKSKSDSIRLAKISQYENTIQSLTNQISKLKMEVDTANQKAKVNEENVRSLRIENYNLQVDVNRKEVESSGNNRKLINQKTNLSSLNKKVREQAALIAKLRANRCYYCPNTDSDSD